MLEDKSTLMLNTFKHSPIKQIDVFFQHVHHALLEPLPLRFMKPKNDRNTIYLSHVLPLALA